MGDGLNRLMASGAAVAAVAGAVASGRLPRWLRVTLVLGLCVLAAGAGLSAYRYVTRPVTLTVAAGSLDGDAPRYVGAVAARLAATSSPIRLRLIEKGTLTEATYIPIHPGAAAYFNGDQQSFFDRYGDQIFYGSMLFGSLTSLFAAAWRYMAGKPDDVAQRPLTRLYGLSEAIRTADETRLSEVESAIDDLLKIELDRLANVEDGNDGALLALAAQRLQYLIVQRRASLATPPVR